jgi:Uma2 family endonuclease
MPAAAQISVSEYLATPFRPQEKIEDSLKMGVPHVWVIDPRRRGYHYTADGMREAKDGILRTSEPELTVPLAALFD